MAVTTIADAISSMLSTNWNLAAPLAAANIHFDVGWIDRVMLGHSDAAPQVVVSGPMPLSPNRFFGRFAEGDAGLHILSYHRYLINVWVRVPAGALGVDDDYMDYADRIRNEVVRIVNEYRCSITDPVGVTLVIPLDYGRALHELDMSPRFLRFEITVQANFQI